MADFSKYRRPATKNAQDFWFCSKSRWNDLLQDAGGDDKQIRKTALNNLVKYDAAGRIMETDEGGASQRTCSECERKGVVCHVFTLRDDTVCAYCRRNARAACNAKAITPPPPRDLEQELDEANVRIAQLENAANMLGDANIRIAQLEAQVEAQKEQMKHIIEVYKAMADDISTLFKRSYGLEQ